MQFYMKILYIGKFSMVINFQGCRIHKKLTHKINGENLLHMFHYCTFCLAKLIHIVMYLFIVHGLLRYFKKNLHDGSLPNPTGPLPVLHHSIL